MKICSACGMPAPPATAACAFCGGTFDGSGTMAFRLDEQDGAFVWHRDGLPPAVATWAAGMCHVRLPDQDDIVLTLVAVENDGRVRVAMVDAQARLVSTLVPANDRTVLSTVCDRYEQTRLLVKGDGPTGIHIIDPQGNVVAVASRDITPSATRPLALDVLVLRPSGDGELLMFAVVLATELLRSGDLRPVG